MTTYNRDHAFREIFDEIGPMGGYTKFTDDEVEQRTFKVSFRYESKEGTEANRISVSAYNEGREPKVAAMVATLASVDTPKAARDLALVRLLFDLGLRRGEAVALDLTDIDLERCTVMIVGKGRTEAEPVTLTDRTRDALAAWIEHRGTEPGPLFIKFDRPGKGGRLTGRSVARIVNAIGADVGAGHVSPHGMRHTALRTGSCLRSRVWICGLSRRGFGEDSPRYSWA